MSQNRKDLATANVATAPSPATSGLSLVVAAGQGANFPDAPFYITAVDNSVLPTVNTAEILLVTAKSTDTFTIVRAQKGTTAKSITNTWRVFNGIYADDIETGFGSNGSVTPIANYYHFESLDSGWTTNDFYGAGGTAAHDTVDYVNGSASFKLTTPSNNSRIGFYKNLAAPLDMLAGAIHMWVKTDDLNHLDDIGILMAESDTFDDFFQLNVKDFVVNMNNDEWTEVTFTRSNFSVGGGTPNWNNINTIMLRALAQNTFTPNVWFDGVGFVDDGVEAYVTITFDDGYASTFTEGKKYMDKYGMKGTSYPVPDFIGTATYMTQEQVDLLHEGGWDISGHAEGSLGLDTQEERLVKIKRGKDYCRSHGYRGQNEFAYPNGVFTRAIMRDGQRFFGTLRGLENYSVPTSCVVPTLIPAKNVTNVTSTATIQGWIDDAIDDKAWLVLSFHHITASPSGAVEYATADFQTVVDYLATANVKVLPMTEVLKRLT